MSMAGVGRRRGAAMAKRTDDRELDLADRPGRPQPLRSDGGVAEVFLAREVVPLRHCQVLCEPDSDRAD
jgi:hypothetical protein